MICLPSTSRARERLWGALCSALIACVSFGLQAAEPVLIRGGRALKTEVVADAFGKGRDGVRLRGSRTKCDQLRWTGLGPGTFWMGLETWGVTPSTYLLNEFTTGALKLYVNDTPVPWGGHTEPRRGGRGRYWGELRSRSATELHPEDTVRVVYRTFRQWVVVGR